MSQGGLIERAAVSGAHMITFVRHRTVPWLVGFAGLVALLLLGMYRQPYYPSPWLDEGFVLQGAINLVRYGQYAMKSVEGFRVLDQPLIANGPGIVLPLAGAFALFGVGLLQARLVMVVYLVLTAILFFAVARQLYGPVAAVLSLFLLVAVPQEGFLWFGRMALGNVPALGYFLAGCLLWLVLLKRKCCFYAVGAGLFFGLAMVTKGQYGLVIPVLLLVALADVLYYWQVGVRWIGLVLVGAFFCLGLWYLVQLALVGWESFPEHLDAVRSSSRATVFALRPARIPGSLMYLIRSGMPLFVVPGLLYAGWSCRKRDLDSYRRLLPLAFVAVWLCWYALASVGWHRYAFAPYAVGLLFAGRFVAGAVCFLRQRDGRLSIRGRMWTVGRVGVALLIAGILLGGARGLVQRVQSIVAPPDLSPERFAVYLRDNVSPGAVVESWEWQIDTLVDLNYHHPSNIWVDRMTAVSQFGEQLAVEYDLFEYRPDYLIDGPWSKWMGLYAAPLADGCCTPIATFGPYDLYRVPHEDME